MIIKYHYKIIISILDEKYIKNAEVMPPRLKFSKLIYYELRALFKNRFKAWASLTVIVTVVGVVVPTAYFPFSES